MKHSALLVLGALSLASLAHAQVDLAASGSYSQNFNSLPQPTTQVPWVDNVTLTGWFADTVSSITGNTGSNSGIDLNSFGSSSSSDRALGSIADDTSGNIAFGIVFRNLSAQTLVFSNLAFRGELWLLASNSGPDRLDFSYKISIGSITNMLGTGWTDVNALDFDTPANPTGGTGAKNGNAVGNFTDVASALNIQVAAGSSIAFRWLDTNVGGNDRGLGIDDLSVTYSAAAPALTAVPEPSTYAMMGCAALVGIVALRRRKQNKA